MSKSSHQLSYVLHTDSHRPYCSCGWCGEGYETEKDAQLAGWHHQHQTAPRAKRKTHPVTWLAFLGLLVVCVGGLAAAGSANNGRVGDPNVYTLLATETSCAELQATFDRADVTRQRPGGPPTGGVFEQERYGDWSDIGLAYMQAADARMRAVGCY